MFDRTKQLKGLEKKISSALGIVTKTIEEIEATNQAYDVVREELETEMEIARMHHMEVLDAMSKNRKVAENFKNLLK